MIGNILAPVLFLLFLATRLYHDRNRSFEKYSFLLIFGLITYICGGVILLADEYFALKALFGAEDNKTVEVADTSPDSIGLSINLDGAIDPPFILKAIKPQR